jgi:predicted RNA-binding Zn-ribbon protein involved in translation (DUF1610 family)
MTVSCSACGQEWPRDPALEVECPKCEAKVGRYCRVRRPSGHTANFGNKTLIHPARDQLAMDMGFLQRCPVAQRQEYADSMPLFAHCQPPAPLLERGTTNDGASP